MLCSLAVLVRGLSLFLSTFLQQLVENIGAACAPQEGRHHGPWRALQNLMDTNTFELRIPIYVNEAWKDAFTKPTNDSTPVSELFFKWLLSALPSMDYVYARC